MHASTTFRQGTELFPKASVLAAMNRAKYWPNEDPLGKRLRIVRTGERPWLTVVGVCQDVRQNDPTRADLDPLMYVPYRHDAARSYAVVARARVAPTTLVPAFRSEV